MSRMNISEKGRGMKSIRRLEDRIEIFQTRLLGWYAQHGRDLPWRHTHEPYHILVSEMMLQQTQVARVIPKYLEWLAAFPTFDVLASASVEEVKKSWRPLGYNYRPVRLHQIAKIVASEFGGKLPSSFEQLVALRGIGRYTAGAILCFAFHQDVPIVDTNIRRVIQRVFDVRGDPARSAVQREIWRWAEALIPEKRAETFNQALMDFGALVCTARNPVCLPCEVRNVCLACELSVPTCPNISNCTRQDQSGLRRSVPQRLKT
jgi:A/G-specific adenine glycosylase